MSTNTLIPTEPDPAAIRKEFLDRRRKFLGSSDAAGIVGLSKWQSPLRVYLGKVGELPDTDDAPKKWGRLLQGTVAHAYSEEMERDVIPPDQETVFHPQYPWMGASVDYMTIVDGVKRILECKTARTSEGWGEPGTDQVPDYYNIQVQHQLCVTANEVADIPVLIAGSDFRVYTIERNDRLIDKLIQIEAAFWELVVSRQAPRIDWEHPDSLELQRCMWGLDTTLTVDLGEEEDNLANLWLSSRAACRALAEQSRSWKQQAERIEARLLHAMGHAGKALTPTGYELRRKEVRRKEYTVQAGSYVKFSVERKESLNGGEIEQLGVGTEGASVNASLLSYGRERAIADQAGDAETSGCRPGDQADHDVSPGESEALAVQPDVCSERAD